MVYIRLHHLQGLGPPGGRDLRQALRALEHVIRAHAAAYHVLHRDDGTAGRLVPHVSIAHHYPAFWPCRRWWPMDQWMTRVTDRIFNLALLEALLDGRWSVPGLPTWRIPEARATLDFLGVNFYGRQFIRWVLAPGVWPGSTCDLGHHPREVTERTSLGWDVYPQALTNVLTNLRRMERPILITENGAYMTDDARRWNFIKRHLHAMARAMQRGAPVIGYCCWSLLDNFEWAEGFGPRFGIVEVDYATQERRVRDSARQYAEVCRTNRISLDDTQEFQ
jgi:beta-glucosidase